ncbi:MAG: hypothetical protein RL308_1503 [Bacteroidota bacterium]|jgi:glycosyltransferase involved in cell wall biosynthesis
MEQIKKTMEKIRILFLITDIGKGGAERYLIDLCKDLQSRPNIEFIIGSLYDSNEYKEETDEFNIVNLNFQTFSLRGQNENLAYKKLLDEFKPQIVHTHRFLAEFLSGYYVDPTITYVCHGHDNMVQLERFTYKTLFSKLKILNFLERRYIKKSKYKQVGTAFIANSIDTLKFYQQNILNSKKNEVILKQYGFNFSKFFHSKTNENLVNRKIKILNVGSFQDKKNQIFIIEIAKELEIRNIEFEINLIGQGQNQQKVQDAIDKNGLQDNVKLRGLIHNVKDWYSEADFYLHTAYYEPFGLVFLEAMASKAVIVTLDGIGNRDLIKQGVNGYIFTEQNPILFAEKIIELKENRELYESIAENAQQFSEKFSIETKTDDLIVYYQKLMPKN